MARDRILSLRLDDPTHAEVTRRATQANTSASEWARRVLDRELRALRAADRVRSEHVNATGVTVGSPYAMNITAGSDG